MRERIVSGVAITLLLTSILVLTFNIPSGNAAETVYFPNTVYANVRSCQFTLGAGDWIEPILNTVGLFQHLSLGEIGVLEITEPYPVSRVEVCGSGCEGPVTLTCNGITKEVSYFHDSEPYGEETLVFDIPPSNIITLYTTIHIPEDNHGFGIKWISVRYASDWPMYGHDPSHTGRSPSLGPQTNNLIWKYKTGDAVDASPAIVDNKVYIASNDRKIYCLDASTGKEIWNYTTGSFAVSSAAVAYGRVYVGSFDWKVYCLDALTGGHIWNYTTGDYVQSSPTVLDDRVYVGSADKLVYCLNASNGAQLWNYTTGNKVESSPAVAEGRVYVGSYDRKVYCLDAITGAEIWTYLTGNYVSCSPTVSGDKIYIGSTDGVFRCLDAATGVLKWSNGTGEIWHSAPAVAYGMVYVGSWSSYRVYCFNASSGEPIWSFLTGDYVHASPAVADGRVYVGSHDKKVYCLNATTGTQIWSYATNNSVCSSAAVANGLVIVGSDDGEIYAFGDLHDVAVTEVKPLKNFIGQGYRGRINVTVTNQGDFSETFALMLSAGTMLPTNTICTVAVVNLLVGETRTITMAWNTSLPSLWPKANYTIIMAYANLPGDVDPGDNTCTGGWIFVSIPGDTTPEYRLVDIFDVVKITSIYEYQPTDPRYDPNSDIDDNDFIDIFDVVACTSHYEETW